jgi:hypothetical protein
MLGRLLCAKGLVCIPRFYGNMVYKSAQIVVLDQSLFGSTPKSFVDSLQLWQLHLGTGVVHQ